jgi:hypothetical protein
MATKKKLALDATGRFPQQIGPDDVEDAGKADPQAALLERLARLEGQLTGLQTTLGDKERTIASLMEAPVVKYEAPKPVKKADLPDPVTNPQEYAAAVRQGILDELNANRQAEDDQRAQQDTYNKRLGALWNDFATENPTYAANQEAVRLAATAVAEEIASRGQDVQKFMFGAPAEFKAAVKVKMDKLGMAPKAEADDDDADDTDDDRTLGVFGGMESGGNKAGAQAVDKPGSLFDGLKDWQINSGFHR